MINRIRTNGLIIIFALFVTSFLIIGCKSNVDHNKKAIGPVVEHGMVVSAREEPQQLVFQY